MGDFTIFHLIGPPRLSEPLASLVYRFAMDIIIEVVWCRPRRGRQEWSEGEREGNVAERGKGMRGRWRAVECVYQALNFKGPLP